jgi:flagellar basal body rod protein FlgC
MIRNPLSTAVSSGVTCIYLCLDILLSQISNSQNTTVILEVHYRRTSLVLTDRDEEAGWKKKKKRGGETVAAQEDEHAGRSMHHSHLFSFFLFFII